MKSEGIHPSVDLALLILRVGVSVLMLVHGWAKLQRALSGDLGFADPIGMGETTSLFATIFAEFFCSILLILGFLTRPALLFLIFTMCVIVFVVHAGEYDKQEHALLYLIPYVAIFILGPGRYSMDYRWLNKLLGK